mgnify:CR=1 FL=1
MGRTIELTNDRIVILVPTSLGIIASSPLSLEESKYSSKCFNLYVHLVLLTDFYLLVPESSHVLLHTDN